MISATTLVLLGGFASTALAHGTVWGYTTDGIYHENNHPNPEAPKVVGAAGWFSGNTDRGFVSTGEYKTPDIICHKDARPSPHSATVSAGGTVQFHWTPWDASHMGPVMTYVANCRGDCANVDKETLKWVKIDEMGINEKTGEWAAVELIGTNNTWTTKVPETLVPGKYVFRHEIIAIYGVQHYPSCINIEITGSGTDDPEGVLGTELYGIQYRTAKGDEYVVPGPPPYTPPATSPSPPAASPSTQPASDVTSSTTTNTITSTTVVTVISSTTSVSEPVALTATASASTPAPTTSAIPTRARACGSRRHRRHARAVRN
ncbi:hypothetical protein VTK26DRAFT_7737 [Humicola hyalothermophila]